MGIGMARRDIKKQVRKWFEEEGMFEEDTEDPKSVFNYVVNYPVNIRHKMNVVQPRDGKDKVMVLSGTRFEPEAVERMRGMPAPELDDLLWDLRLSLCARPTEFELSRTRENGAPEAVLISTIIYADGLTKDRLMRAVRDVYKSKLIALWKIQQRTGK
jgi:hypothetical protein